MEEQQIKAIIIQYEDSIRYQKKLLDCYFAETLLSGIPIYMKNQKILETRLKEKTEQCRRLKSTLESAHYRVAKFYAKYSENTAVKEYLDFAVFLSTFRNSNDDISSASNLEVKFFQYFDISLDIDYNEESNKDEHESNGGRLQSDEITSEGKCPIKPLNIINEDMLTLNSKLELAQESLNAEKLQSSQLKCERDRLDYLSDELCCLLFKYQKRISIPAGKTEKSCQTSHDNTACDSSLFTQKNTLQPDIEFPFDELTLALSQNSQENNSPGTDINEASILSITSEQIPDSENVGMDQILADLSDVLFRDQLPDLSNENQILGDVLFIFEDQLLELPNEVSQEALVIDNILEYVPENEPENELDNEPENEPKNKQENIQEKGRRAANERVLNSICETGLVNDKKEDENNEPSNVGNTSRETIENKVSNVRSDTCNEICLKSHFRRHIHHVHQCPVCAKKFTDNSNYKKHIAVHSEKRFKCSICHKLFRNLIAKNKHQQAHHIDDACYQCAHCERRYSGKANLSYHIYSCHFPEVSKEFKCTLCDKSFVYKSFLKTHQLKHKSQQLTKCSKRIHHHSHSNQEFQNSNIDIEKSITCSNNALPKSTIKPHESHCPPYHCEKCDKSYPGEKDGQKLVKCPVCDALEHHTSHEVPGQHCNICNRSFAWRSLLERHIKSVHSKVKPFKCSQCDKCFALKERLKMHAYVHETQKSFECSICKQRFKHLSYKRRHEEIHHKKIGLFQCTHCNKQYGYKSGLIHHIRTKHFSDVPKNFKCTLCDKAFTLKSVLKVHQSVHSSDKLVKCSICDKKFKTNVCKKRHEWLVHGKGDRFHCAHCENVYGVKHNLLGHLQKNHADLFGP